MRWAVHGDLRAVTFIRRTHVELSIRGTSVTAQVALHAEPDLIGLGGVYALYAYVDRFRAGDELIDALRRNSVLEAVDLDQIDTLRWLITARVDAVVRRLSNLASGP